MSIRLRLLGGFLFVLCLTTGVAAVGWLGLSDYARRVDAAAAGQTVAAQINALALAAERAVAAGDAGAQALHDPADQVRAGIDALRRAVPGDSGAIGQVQDSIDQFNGHLREYADQDRQRVALVTSRVALIGQFETVAAEIADAQGLALTAAAGAEQTGRAAVTSAGASLQVLPFLMDAVGGVREANTQLQAAVTPDTTQGVLDALDWLDMTAKSTAHRAGAEQAAASIQSAIAAWRAQNTADPQAGRDALPGLVDTIGAAVKTITSSFNDGLLAVSARHDDQMTQLAAATELRQAALRTETMALRARLAEEALVWHHDPAAAAKIVASADAIEASSKDLLYRVTEPAVAEKLKALIAQIGDYKQGLRRLTGAQDRQVSLLRDVNAATAAAIAESGSLTDGQLAAMRAEHQRANLLLGVGVSLALALGLALAVAIGRGITRPLLALAGVMERLAGGDKNVDIPGLERRDELREVAAAVVVFRDNALAMDRMEEEHAEAEARAKEEKRQAVVGLAESLDRAVSSVIDSIGTAAHDLQSTARGLTANAEATRDQATAASEASDMALANVQAVAAAAEELSVSIAEVARQTQTSVAVSGRAMETSSHTGVRIAKLNAAAQHIETVVALIHEIASRTNLLALNATIEAARAGAAGAGFAVVASEVKQLAAQTAKATDEIAGQIGGMQEAAREMAEAIEAITRIIGEMGTITAGISTAVDQQGLAAGAIARNILLVASGTEAVSGGISGVSDAARETGDAAGVVLSAAAALANDSGSLRGQVRQFLRQVANG